MLSLKYLNSVKFERLLYFYFKTICDTEAIYFKSSINESRRNFCLPLNMTVEYIFIAVLHIFV